jgi:hypothetical protein
MITMEIKVKKVLTFDEVGRFEVASGREVVISKVKETGNISIAQQLTVVNAEGMQFKYFPKHSTTILNDEQLKQYIAVLQKAVPSETPTTNKKSKGVKSNG